MKKYLFAFIAVTLFTSTPFSIQSDDHHVIEPSGKTGYDQT